MMLPSVLAAAVAAFAPTSCAWTDPGRDPYVGTVEQALDRYPMPAAVRVKLAAMVRANNPTDIAVLTRDSMTGKLGSYELQDMHFGRGRVCRTMDRSAWSATYSVDRVPVYAVGEHRIAIPSICGNVSRVTLLQPPMIRSMPPGSAIDPPTDLEGGSSSAKQALPADSFAARVGALAMPSASIAVPMPSGGPADPALGGAADSPGLGGSAGGRLLIGGAAIASAPGGVSVGQAAVGGDLVAAGGLATVSLPAIVEAIPEPSTWALFATGLALLMAAVWMGRSR